MYRIGVVGSGQRMTPLVERLLEYDDFEVGAVCDPKIEEMKAKYQGEKIGFYTDAEEMLQKERLDCLMIGTRCSLHTPLMLLAAKAGLPTFLEKPVAIDEEQLMALEELFEMDKKVVVSFPLRNAPIVNEVRSIIKSGKIGKVAQVQAYNNVNYGRGYYHKWYRDEKETGGLWLQKATHDFDYINSLLEVQPVQIAAMDAKMVFKGDQPKGQKCVDCAHRRDCPESDLNVGKYGDPFIIGEYCCFAEDTGNQDSGSALVLYENGMHATYTQNFITRKGAGKRGARLIGYYGTLEFDFNTGEITLFYHNKNHIERHKIEKTRGHSGGDEALIQNFANVVRGVEESKAPLSEGILSAKMCLLAKRSAKEKRFFNIEEF